MTPRLPLLAARACLLGNTDDELVPALLAARTCLLVSTDDDPTLAFLGRVDDDPATPR